MNDGMKVTGRLHLRVWRAGLLVLDWADANVVTDVGRSMLTRLLVADAGAAALAHIGVGSSSNPAAPSDTELADAFSRAITSCSFATPMHVVITWAIEQAEAVGLDIQEFGLLDALGVTLFARRVKAIGIKTAGMRIEGTWTLSFD